MASIPYFLKKKKNAAMFSGEVRGRGQSWKTSALPSTGLHMPPLRSTGSRMDGAWFPPSKGQLTTAVMTKNNVSTTSDRRELRVPWAIHAGVSGELLALLTKQRERVRFGVGLFSSYLLNSFFFSNFPSKLIVFKFKEQIYC
jgi:hypothetical protein